MLKLPQQKNKGSSSADKEEQPLLDENQPDPPMAPALKPIEDPADDISQFWLEEEIEDSQQFRQSQSSKTNSFAFEEIESFSLLDHDRKIYNLNQQKNNAEFTKISLEKKIQTLKLEEGQEAEEQLTSKRKRTDNSDELIINFLINSIKKKRVKFS